MASLETPGNVRILEIVVVVLGVILLLGFVTVIARIVYLATLSAPAEVSIPAANDLAPTRTSEQQNKASQSPGAQTKSDQLTSDPAAPRGPMVLSIPIPGRIEALTIDGNRLIVGISTAAVPGEPERRQILILDARNAKPLNTRGSQTEPVDGQAGDAAPGAD